MTLQTYKVPPLDKHLFTGPARLMGGVARMGTITLDTPYGTNGNAEFARWIYIGGTGNISIVDWSGNTDVMVGIAAGIWHPIYSIQVNSVGTTATSLLWGS